MRGPCGAGWHVVSASTLTAAQRKAMLFLSRHENYYPMVRLPAATRECLRRLATKPERLVTITVIGGMAAYLTDAGRAALVQADGATPTTRGS
jgi:hypothetical protein